MTDRVSEVRVSGLRSIDTLTLPLNGLTVLIGDNGSGKSSILEALQLLHEAALPFDYIDDVLIKRHGGLRSLLRQAASKLSLGITIKGQGPRLDYDFAIGFEGNSPTIFSEYLAVEGSDAQLKRHGTEGRVAESTEEYFQVMKLDPGRLLLTSIKHPSLVHLQRVVDTLNHMECHVPFETRPLWQEQELEIRSGPRWPTAFNRADKLQRYAVNLANCYQQLRNEGGETWERVLLRARMGLGDDLRDFRLPPSRRGEIELEAVFASLPDKALPADALSEGQLSYLAFIALVELNKQRSLLSFDEPELHLHPALMARVVWMFEEVARESPVVLATHSDRLLDALDNPSHSVRLCELGPTRTTILRRPHEQRLTEWLEDYIGLGAIRAAGFEPQVFEER